ncbi:MAG: tripartite tricarboxylate transporter substrate binding protein [Raoultibacter sp.]
MRKKLYVGLTLLAVAAFFVIIVPNLPSNDEQKNSTSDSAYPNRNLQGTIVWAAGGACDTLSRSIVPYVQESLGQAIIMNNVSGASGVIGTNLVEGQPCDGYNILFGAETTQIYPALGISDLSYNDFEPIALFAGCNPIVLVDKNSPFNTIEELINHIDENPGKVTMGTTGAGGTPYVFGAVLNQMTGGEVNSIPYDGDGPAKTALLGGHIDFTVVTYIGCKSLIESGDVKALAVLNSVPQEGLDAPVITDSYPAYNNFVSLQPFYGAFVKKGTPQNVLDTLSTSFQAAMQTEKYAEFLDSVGAIGLNLTGDEAKRFLEDYEKTCSWVFYDSGMTTINPADLGIERPAEDV